MAPEPWRRASPKATAIPATLCMCFIIAAVFGNAAAVPRQFAASASLSSWNSGTVTDFGDAQTDNFSAAQDNGLVSGVCGYGPVDTKQWPFHALVTVATVHEVAARPNSGCGTCLAIKCVDTRPKACRTNQPLTAVVVNHCSTCDKPTLRLNAPALEEIASPNLGAIQVEYMQVPCEPPGGVQVRVDAWEPDMDSHLRIVINSIAGDGGIVNVLIRPAAPSKHFSDTTNALDQYEAQPSWMAMDNTFGAAWEVTGLPVQAPHGYDLKIWDAVDGQVVLSNAIPFLAKDQPHLRTYTFDQQFDTSTTLSAVLQAGLYAESSSSKLVITGTTVDSAQRALLQEMPTLTPQTPPSPPGVPNTPPSPPLAGLFIPEDTVFVGDGNGTAPQPQSAAPGHVSIDWNAIRNKGVTVGGIINTGGAWLPELNVSAPTGSLSLSPSPALNCKTASPIRKHPPPHPPRNCSPPKPPPKPTAAPSPLTPPVICQATNSTSYTPATCQQQVQGSLSAPPSPFAPGRFFIPEDEAIVAANPNGTNVAALDAPPAHIGIDWTAIKNRGMNVGSNINTEGAWKPGLAASVPPPPPFPRAKLTIPEDIKVGAGNGTDASPADAGPAHSNIDWYAIQNRGVQVGAGVDGAWLPQVQAPPPGTPMSPPLVASGIPPVAKPTCSPPA